MTAPQKFRHKKIEFWDDERDIGNSLIVTLIRGWKFSDDPIANEHVRGFDTVADAMYAVRKETMPCDCKQCV